MLNKVLKNTGLALATLTLAGFSTFSPVTAQAADGSLTVTNDLPDSFLVNVCKGEELQMPSIGSGGTGGIILPEGDYQVNVYSQDVADAFDLLAIGYADSLCSSNFPVVSYAEVRVEDDSMTEVKVTGIDANYSYNSPLAEVGVVSVTQNPTLTYSNPMIDPTSPDYDFLASMEGYGIVPVVDPSLRMAIEAATGTDFEFTGFPLCVNGVLNYALPNGLIYVPSAGDYEVMMPDLIDGMPSCDGSSLNGDIVYAPTTVTVEDVNGYPGSTEVDLIARINPDINPQLFIQGIVYELDGPYKKEEETPTEVCDDCKVVVKPDCDCETVKVLYRTGGSDN